MTDVKHEKYWIHKKYHTYKLLHNPTLTIINICTFQPF